MMKDIHLGSLCRPEPSGHLAMTNNRETSSKKILQTSVPVFLQRAGLLKDKDRLPRLETVLSDANEIVLELRCRDIRLRRQDDEEMW